MAQHKVNDTCVSVCMCGGKNVYENGKGNVWVWRTVDLSNV